MRVIKHKRMEKKGHRLYNLGSFEQETVKY
jgi:hypothetical protein